LTVKYHGCPITPLAVLNALAGCHFCVSYARPEQVAHVRKLGQSLMLDNGAFSAWRRGHTPDWPGFYAWCERWLGPADFAVIPDMIDGDEPDNDALVAAWPHGHRGAPVWHLHESLPRLSRLTDEFPLVCFGSSGDYAQIGTESWTRRMDAAFNHICRGRRFAPRIHGLRMMAMSGRRWPFASVDSTDIARNHNRPQNTPTAMARRWNSKQCPHTWAEQPEQLEFVA
jgi:hypothetical protein